MDSIIVKEQSLGDFATIPANGGMVTVRERPTLQYGQKSLVQNMRCWHPGFETRKGYTKNNSTAYNASADSPLNIYQFVKGKLTEKHLFVQFGNTKLLEATNMPPAAGTTFGTVVHDGSAGQIPASFANINDFMVYSNGADQHQVYAGQGQDIETFIVVKDSGAHGLYPGLGEDYSTEVRDANSGVAILDSLQDYANDSDAIYFMTKTPIDLVGFVVSAANTAKMLMEIDYWNGAWTNDTITDGTLVDFATLAQSGDAVFDTTAVDRTDEIPRYMFNESGFWYKIRMVRNAVGVLDDLTDYDLADPGSTMTITAPKIEFVNLEHNDQAYVTEDFGAGFFGDFSIDFETTITSSADGADVVMACVTNRATSGVSDWSANNNAIYVYAKNLSGHMSIFIKDENTDNTDSWQPAAGNSYTKKYLTFARSGTTLTCTIYSDSGRTVVVDTLTITCEAGTKRYFYALGTWWSGSNFKITGSQENYYLPGIAESLDSEVELSHVTYDCETFIDLVNVWNGIPTDLVEAHFFDDTEAQWDVYAASVITLSDMTSSDELYLASNEQLEAIYFGFGNTPNTSAAPTITIKYWDGSAFQNTTEVDGTTNWTETGWISFGRQSGEFKRQFRDTKYYAYWYQITVSSTISDDVVASVLGMPYFDINKLGSIGRVSATWKNRALYSFNKFPRDLYVSEANEHMKLNGSDFAILQPGDGRDNATVAAVNFHNEVMVFQEEVGSIGGCVTIFEGYSPATFGKLVLSTKIGTFSAKTVKVVDGSKTSTTKRDLNSQTQVYFLSHYGVFMSDGRIVTAVSDDIQNYFDPRFAECIRKGYESEMWLEHDSTENVIKIGIVSGSSATTCNKFFVYDLSDGVWYEDIYATSLSVAREVEAGSGQFFTRLISAGSTTGFVYLMNDGTQDDGGTIVSKLTWEFNNGAYFLSINEFLTRMKVSASQVYTLTAEENDVQVFSESGSLSAYATNETMIRNRHLTDFDQRSWCSITLQASVPIYLYDCGIDTSSVMNK